MSGGRLAAAPPQRQRQKGIPLPAARSRQSEGNKSHGTRAQQRIKSWTIGGFQIRSGEWGRRFDPLESGAEDTQEHKLFWGRR
eukprot:6335449-Amphidinium_carterae.1